MKTFTIVIIVLVAALSLVFPRAALGATYTVTNALPAGFGSLDWAITQANNNPGPDNITFNIQLPFPGPYTIPPPPGGFQALWDQAGATIDGYTQPGAVPNTAPQGQPSNAILMIELDGSQVPGPISGLYVASSNNVIRGLVINSFNWGIVIDGFSGGGAIMNRILGCYVGTDVSGTQDDGCWDSGIYIWGGAQNNFIGDGTDPGRNLCSGSDFQQIGIVGGNTNFNYVLGNFVGTELNGMAAIGNVGTAGAGVCIYNDIEGGSPKNNEVGRTQPGERNIISGNPWDGVEISGAGTDFNLVRNNYIGTDVSGIAPVGNGTAGVYILDGAAWNTVGGATVAHRNVISNNNWGAWGCGVDIDDGAHDNTIEGNYIGTDVSGMLDHGNLRNGVHIVDGSPDNTVRNNLIYWNRIDQVRIEGTGSDRNTIVGNSLGRSRIIVDLPNGTVGVHVLAGAQHNVIGNVGSGNLIEINTDFGVEIDGATTDYNLLQGNMIRDNAYWGNLAGYGVFIHGGAQHNDIGPGNVIYNNSDGVRIDGLNTISNRITQNGIYNNSGKAIETINGGNLELPPPFISSALPTGVSGGTQPPLLNGTIEIFSDHADECSTYAGTTPTDLVGNFSWSGSATGPNVTATATDALGNTSECSSPAYLFVVVNTNDAGYGSLRQAILNANAFAGPNTITTAIPTSDPNYNAGTGIWTIRVQSPLPTLTDNGTTLEASQQWIEIDGSSAGLTANGFTITSSQNVIKGSWYISRFAGNGIEISGSGAIGNQVLDCYIGCALTSPYDRGNGRHGIYIHGGANGNTVGDASGGLTPGGIVVAGNDSCGICIRGSGSANNMIVRAYVGNDISGTAVGNSIHGVLIDDGARLNQVGGSGPVLWNWIIYNGQYGICITDADNNAVSSNEIGFHSKVQPNGGGGIRIDGGSQGNTIGGLTLAQGNIICGNYGPGITLSGSGTSTNVIHGCWIGLNPDGLHATGNTQEGILIENGASNNTVGGTTAAERNAISGNGQCGILLRGASTSGNTIKGNYVGPDTSGTAAVGNGQDGIQIRAQASGNTIGGATSASRNVISGNTGNGITVKGSGSDGQIVSGNYIGLNKNGGNLYNHGNGMSLVDSCANHTVSQNNISGNLGDGVYAAYVTTGNTLITQNTIASNTIGVHLFFCRVSAVSVIGNTIYSNTSENMRIDNPVFPKSWRETVASESTIRGNTLSDSPYGIHIASVDAWRDKSSEPEIAGLSTDPPWIHFNNLSGHTKYGMYSDDSLSLAHARNNWWGDATGPYHPQENPDGKGDRVSDYIDFAPWLENPSAVCVTAGEDVEVGPGGTAKVTFRIRSEVARTYDVWVGDSLGWPYDPTYLALSLNAGEEQTVTIDVIASGDVPPGTSDKVTLTAVAQASDPPDQSWDWLMVTVTECVKGDVNADGVINILDVLRVVNIILEVGNPPSEAELCAADCNGDGNINVLDALGIVRVILGFDPECPGSVTKMEIDPEVLKFLASLEPYFAPQDFARFMAMVREVQIPTEYELSQNFPNPFNPTTAVNYQIPMTKSQLHSTLKVYNVLGQEIATLVDGVKEPGYYTVTWDASDMPSGVYFYRLTAGAFTETRRMVLMK